jgi:ribose transport system substrate-binding protein
MMKISKMAGRAACAAGASATASQAFAQKGLEEPFQGPFKTALAGKTVAYIPVAMNFDLTEGWFAGLKRQLEPWRHERSSCATPTGTPMPARRRSPR